MKINIKILNKVKKELQLSDIHTPYIISMMKGKPIVLTPIPTVVKTTKILDLGNDLSDVTGTDIDSLCLSFRNYIQSELDISRIDPDNIITIGLHVDSSFYDPEIEVGIELVSMDKISRAYKSRLVDEEEAKSKVIKCYDKLYQRYTKLLHKYNTDTESIILKYMDKHQTKLNK